MVRVFGVIAALKHTLAECATLVPSLPNVDSWPEAYRQQCLESMEEMRRMIEGAPTRSLASLQDENSGSGKEGAVFSGFANRAH